MSALFYLLMTRLKNTMKSLVQKPARLIYVLFMAAMLGLTVFAGNTADEEARQLRDIRELTAGATALYTLMFLILAKNGFATGGTIFTMPDVNLVFPAPLRQRSVLFYGLLRQIGASLLLSFFILFQYSWIHDLYGASYGFLLILVLGYALAVFFGQFVAMVIYALTSADEKKQRIAKTIYIVYIALLLLWLAVNILPDMANVLPRAVDAISSPVIGFTPVGGWLGRFAYGVAAGEPLQILLGLGLCALLGVILIAIIEKSHADYYEDVIKTAEVSQSAINASRQGMVADTSPKNVKVGKTGFGRGSGAEMFYYKHQLENRRSRVLILDATSLIFAAVVIIFSFFMKAMEGSIIAVFIMSTYMQLFSVSLGRFSRELTKPYIYLLPEPPFAKMLHALRESLPSAVVESILVYVPIYFILGLSVPELICCILARISFALLYQVSNVAVMRIWKGSSSKMVIMLLYILTMVILAAPGIVLAVVGSAVGAALLPFLAGSAALPLLIMTVVNIPVGLLGLFLCRNMLQYAELNYQ